jgi:hypothetical protein
MIVCLSSQAFYWGSSLLTQVCSRYRPGFHHRARLRRQFSPQRPQHRISRIVVMENEGLS